MVGSLIQCAGVTETEWGSSWTHQSCRQCPPSHLLQAAGHKVAELLGVLLLIQLGGLLLNNEVEEVPEAQLGLEPWSCTALHKVMGVHANLCLAS